MRVTMITLALVLGIVSAQAATSRSSWVVSEIYAYNHPWKVQLPQELATKMQKMKLGAFAFYRGTAHLFYKDMQVWPVSAYSNSKTNKVWLEGDMHLQNLGAFKDASGATVFDATDFDEGFWGPYTWDVRRMAVSIVLAARELGLSSNDQSKLVTEFVDEYLDQMNAFSGNDSETSAKLTGSNTSGEVDDLIDKAKAKTRGALLAKYTQVVSGQRKFLPSSELQAVSSSTYTAINSSMSSYISSIASSKRYPSSHYTVKDIALKLGSGTGSLGRYRFYVLVQGSSSSNDDDVILELKQETTSAVAIAAGSLMPASSYGSHQGQRVALTTKAMLLDTDVWVGYTTIASQPYFVREKSPYAEDFDYTKLTSYDKFFTAVGYAGKALARLHALSDKDYNSSLISIGVDKEISDVTAGKKAEFKDEISRFAVAYADQVQLDYQSFVNAYNSGTTLY